MSVLETDLVQAATGTNTALKIKGKGSGVVKLGDGELSFPDADGSSGQILKTDGSGSLSFTTSPAANSVDSDQYVDGSIDAAHLASNAVTTAKINADAVTGAKIADDAIDSEHYTDGSIDTAHIADNQITLAKMAGGTDGNVISYDASGDPVAIATGNDGQVLTSTGAGSPPAFEDASGGATTLIGSDEQTSAVSALTVTGLASAQDGFLISFHVDAQTDDTGLEMRFGDSGGIDSGASDYSYHIRSYRGGSDTPVVVKSGGADNMNLTASNPHTMGTGTNEGVSGLLFVGTPGDNVKLPGMSGHADNASQNAGEVNMIIVAGHRNASITVDRVTVLASSGNVTGRLTVTGINFA
jgi:hypothetical protein